MAALPMSEWMRRCNSSRCISRASASPCDCARRKLPSALRSALMITGESWSRVSRISTFSASSFFTPTTPAFGGTAAMSVIDLPSGMRTVFFAGASLWTLLLSLTAGAALPGKNRSLSAWITSPGPAVALSNKRVTPASRASDSSSREKFVVKTKMGRRSKRF